MTTDTKLAEVMARARDALPTVGEREDVWCSVRGGDLRTLLTALGAAPKGSRQLVSVSSIDIERMLAECVPGGSVCDPQQVADAIRCYCDAWNADDAAAPVVASPPAEQRQDEARDALLRQALEALEYHREQTRPIHQTDEVIAALRAVLADRG